MMYTFSSLLFPSVPCPVFFHVFHPTTHRDSPGARARACKVARLVGAAAAALLRGPRVAPGARLPVVCQRLRVEFIQIKAVE